MVIELSGVQFGLKSYAWFQIRTRAQREFDLKSQVWFQTKIARHQDQLPLYYSHFEIAEFSQWSSIQFVQKWKQKALTSNLVFKTGMMRYVMVTGLGGVQFGL